MSEVRFSTSFLHQVVLAGVEAYALGDAGPGRKKNGKMVETIGDVWGARRTFPLENSDHPHELLYADSFSQSLAATRKKDSVHRDQNAQDIAVNVMGVLSPQFRLLGDLHTHPYEDLSEVTYNKGWQFSDPDLASLMNDDALWLETNDCPLSMVLAVCRLKKVHDSSIEWPSQNILRFDVGEFRFWLNAGIGWLDKNGNRRFSGNTHSKCFLLPPGHFNMSGSRI